MKHVVLTIILGICLISCSNNKNRPDISKVQVSTTLVRFDQELFRLDTNNMAVGMQTLMQKHPSFFSDFMNNILGIPANDPQAVLVLKAYIKEFQPVYGLTQKTFQNFTPYARELDQMLRYVKYYFPKYQVPAQLICFIGPMDAFYQNSLGWSGDIITSAGLGIGLQLHLGGSSPLYEQDEGRGYPAYISRRFEPGTIVVNAATNVIDDLYPAKATPALIDQMIDKGKRLYVLDQLLPDVADSLKIGYTGKQLEACEKNEGLIWNFFLENNLIFETDFEKIKPYVTDGPKTQELGDEAPGFIGLYVGKKIVEQFMDKHPDMSLSALLEYDNRKLFEAAGYKPRR